MNSIDILNVFTSKDIPFFVLQLIVIILSLITIGLILKDYFAKLINLDQCFLWMIASIFLFGFFNPFSFLSYITYRTLKKRNILKSNVIEKVKTDVMKNSKE